MHDKENVGPTRIAELIIAFLMLAATCLSGYTACVSNDISKRQIIIENNNHAPEFAYLGPAETERVGSNDDSIEEFYGFCPRFTKISGFANGLKCEAVSRYAITIGTKEQANIIFGPHTYEEYERVEKQLQTVLVDIEGEFFNSRVAVDNSMFTLTLDEARAKLLPDALTQYLSQYGYAVIHVEGYCVGHIQYMNVENETCLYPFVLDLASKNEISAEKQEFKGEPIVLKNEQGKPNRGFTDEKLEDCAAKIVEQIKNPRNNK